LEEVNLKLVTEDNRQVYTVTSVRTKPFLEVFHPKAKDSGWLAMKKAWKKSSAEEVCINNVPHISRAQTSSILFMKVNIPRPLPVTVYSVMELSSLP
jgi:hypothetical protein